MPRAVENRHNDRCFVWTGEQIDSGLNRAAGCPLYPRSGHPHFRRDDTAPSPSAGFIAPPLIDHRETECGKKRHGEQPRERVSYRHSSGSDRSARPDQGHGKGNDYEHDTNHHDGAQPLGSGHVQRTRRCPLSANSGHGSDAISASERALFIAAQCERDDHRTHRR